jgi:TetR/AcrR family transcriptional repressor of lmrAB and yxaGH operons
MLSTAAGLFQRQGYNATGLNQVLAESSAPKGSLYFHFPDGKEQLAAEAVTLAGRELGDGLAAAIATAPDVRTAIVLIGELLARNLEESDYHEGCPVATVALEAAADSEPIRAACAGTYSTWTASLARYLRGQGVPEPEVEPLALLVLSSIQGALLFARVQRDAAVVRSVSQRIAGVAAAAVQTAGVK